MMNGRDVSDPDAVLVRLNNWRRCFLCRYLLHYRRLLANGAAKTVAMMKEQSGNKKQNSDARGSGRQSNEW